MTFRSNLRKFQSVPLSEKFIFVSSLALLPLTGLGLRVLGLKRCQAIFLSISPSNAAVADAPEDFERARSTARMVRAAATHGAYPAKCLPQSLLLWWILRKRGIHSELKIGLQKELVELHAHAWIQVGTEVINDAPDVGDRFNSLVAWNR